MKETDLEYTQYKRYARFEALTNTGNMVNYLLDQNQMFKNTYRTVQNLRYALEHSDYETFIKTLHHASNLQVAPGLKRVLRTFTKFEGFIQNSFIHPQLTNGPIEGINNKIKVLKRNAYGYKNYYHFKNRILLISRLYVSCQKEKETKQFLAA